MSLNSEKATYHNYNVYASNRIQTSLLYGLMIVYMHLFQFEKDKFDEA